MNHINFLKTAIKDYKIVGAPAATSKYVGESVVRELEADDAFIVEYGAGDGVITKRLLRCLPVEGKIVAVELHPGFLPDLKKIADPRLQVLHDNVIPVSRSLTLLGLPRIDAVVSGIPFSFIPSAIRREVIRNTHAALRESGKFIIYQYTLLLLPSLKKVFRKVEWRLEPRNFPPCFIMIAKK